MSKRDLVLQLLRDAGPRGVTTAALLEAGCGSRFGARVQELRKAGLTIDVERVREGSYRYTLRDGAPDNSRAADPPALDTELETEQLFAAAARPLNAALHDWDGQ